MSGTRLTPLKIARAEAALLNLLACADLPDHPGDETYGDVRSAAELILMEKITPLMRRFWSDET